jgi:hypothetical protein
MITTATAPTGKTQSGLEISDAGLVFTVAAKFSDGTSTGRSFRLLISGTEIMGLAYGADGLVQLRAMSPVPGLANTLINTWRDTQGNATVKGDAVLAVLQSNGVIPL